MGKKQLAHGGPVEQDHADLGADPEPFAVIGKDGKYRIADERVGRRDAADLASWFLVSDAEDALADCAGPQLAGDYLAQGAYRSPYTRHLSKGIATRR